MALPADIVARISRRLADHAGLELPAWVVEARASAAIEYLGCADDDYVELIFAARGLGELTKLVEAVRVGESSLFRHRQQIATLVDGVVPELRAKKRRALSVWSAGCSAGQEPYTLAVVLTRALPDCHVSITATDVSDEALADARANLYPANVIDDIPAEYRDAFEIDARGVSVIADIARCVRFEKKNLIESTMRDGKFDVVWCRNVLIYFSAEARKRAIDHLIEATAPGGYIFVGYSESLRDIAELQSVRSGESVFYRKPERPSIQAPHAPAGFGARSATPPAGVPAIRPSGSIPPSRPPVGRANDAVATRPSSARLDDTGDRPPVASPLGGAIAAKSAGRSADRSREPAGGNSIKLTGRPDAAALTIEIARQMREVHPHVTVDLDGAEILDATLVPVLRRAAAAARAAGGELILRATRSSTRGWLERQGFEVGE